MSINYFKEIIITLHVLSSVVFTAYTQNVINAVGASQWMIGGSSAAHIDVYSTINNAGAIAETNGIQAGIYSEQRFVESKLRLSNASLVVPTRFLTVGLGVNYFGYQAFNQQRIALSGAKKLSETISLGVQLNYIATNIEGYGNAGNIAFGLGLFIKPVTNLRLGFSLFNPTQNRYGEFAQEKMPTYAKLGLAYDVSEKVTLHSEADQTLDQRIILRGGVLYKIHPKFHLAIGGANNPATYTFGTSLYLKAFKLDLATSIHHVLGVTPHLGVSLPIAN